MLLPRDIFYSLPLVVFRSSMMFVRIKFILGLLRIASIRERSGDLGKLMLISFIFDVSDLHLPVRHLLDIS